VWLSVSRSDKNQGHKDVFTGVWPFDKLHCYSITRSRIRDISETLMWRWRGADILQWGEKLQNFVLQEALWHLIYRCGGDERWDDFHQSMSTLERRVKDTAQPHVWNTLAIAQNWNNEISVFFSPNKLTENLALQPILKMVSANCLHNWPILCDCVIDLINEIGCRVEFADVFRYFL